MEGFGNMSSKKNATEVTQSSKQKNEKFLNPKKYIYAILILLSGIMLALYVFEWYQVKKEERLMTSYLISSNTLESSINDLDALNQIRLETPSSYFIYNSYTGSEDVYNLEKGLKRIIDKYKLNDIFYYVDLTELKNTNENYLKEIKNKLSIKKIENIPAIIYVSNGQIKNSDILDGVGDTLVKSADLEQLLDIYEFEIVK